MRSTLILVDRRASRQVNAASSTAGAAQRVLVEASSSRHRRGAIEVEEVVSLRIHCPCKNQKRRGDSKVDVLSVRIEADLQARRTTEMSVAAMKAEAQAGAEATPAIQRREPSGPSERMRKFMEQSERIRNGADVRDLAPLRPSIPSQTDRLPPAYEGDMTRADNHVSKLHTEIKLDGKVIARIYNGGAAEFADDYAYLAKDFGGETLMGPDLAEQRLAKVTTSLVRSGATLTNGSNPAQGKPGKSVAELQRATTAQSQEEWLAFKATEPPPPGMLFSWST